jgi:hypothetical protein
MPARLPLVIGATGFPQQLQSGDTLNVPSSGTTNTPVTNSEATAVVIGAPVYSFATGAVKKAQANAAGTSSVSGLMFDVSTAAAGVGQMATSGDLSATTTQWDAVTGQTGGLTFNSVYFLDPTTAGKMTVTPPTTVGQSLVRLGKAISTTVMSIDINDPVLL